MSLERRHFLRSHVRVGAPFEQNVDQPEKRRAIDAVFLSVGVEVLISCFHGGPQRRAAVPIAGPDIRAAIDQEPGDIHVVVRNGLDQRRDAVGVSLVHIGLRRHEGLDDVEAAVARVV